MYDGRVACFSWFLTSALRARARQLDKRIKKKNKTVSVREKTGMWGYKAWSIVFVNLPFRDFL